MSRDLADEIRDLASRGEITHLSLHPNTNTKPVRWSASFSPSSVFGNSYGEDADPVEAIFAAIDGIKLRRPKTAPTVTKERENPRVPEPEQDLSDILG